MADANDHGLLSAAETSLLIDQYELAMTASYHRRGMNEPAVFATADRAVSPNGMVLLAALGALSAVGGWGVIVALDIEPSATLLPEQPGGVFGEVLVGAVLGAALGAALLWRRGVGSPSAG